MPDMNGLEHKIKAHYHLSTLLSPLCPNDIVYLGEAFTNVNLNL